MCCRAATLIFEPFPVFWKHAEVWENDISAEIGNNPVETIPRHMALIVEAQGEMTKY